MKIIFFGSSSSVCVCVCVCVFKVFLESFLQKLVLLSFLILKFDLLILLCFGPSLLVILAQAYHNVSFLRVNFITCKIFKFSLSQSKRRIISSI